MIARKRVRWEREDRVVDRLRAELLAGLTRLGHLHVLTVIELLDAARSDGAAVSDLSALVGHRPGS